MNEKFMYVLDEILADKYESQGLYLMNKTQINGTDVWLFLTDNKKLNFENIDKSKVLFTNRLNF